MGQLGVLGGRVGKGSKLMCINQNIREGAEGEHWKREGKRDQTFHQCLFTMGRGKRDRSSSGNREQAAR